jgi:UDP-N-acetylmuramyl pentapeptide phosphotransferase/UDP-N-acetylglucosamine-1-phosphate transferase
MQLIDISILIFISIFLINHLIKSTNFLLDNKKSSSHKIFIDKNTKPPFSGGILILLSLLILIPNSEINFKIIVFLIFMTGFLSDISILKSANLRFIIQIILVFFALIILEKYIQSVRVNFLDIFLTNFYFKLFFTSFCILVLVNGTNFIDGLNTVVVGYYLLIIFFISSFYSGDEIFILNYEIVTLFSIILLSILILNGLNFLYLGDNGAYLLSFFIAIVLIDLSNNLKTLSPYYIVNLLWYPAYETLFSIIRKLKNNKSPLKPDNLHLHQLIYLFIKRKIDHIPKIINTISGITINVFNFVVFFVATLNYSNTKAQIAILLFSLLIYNFIYFILKKNR